MASSSPKKIAILGGGIGSIITAFRLSDPALSGKYQVTVYQQGWRLGGKCASGRNVQRREWRIEEHGLHVWFGAYDHAFQAIDACFSELNRDPAVPIRSLQTAFLPCSEVVFCQQDGGIRIPFEFYPADNSLSPGHPTEPPGLWQILATALRWFSDWFTELAPEQEGETGPFGEAEHLVEDIIQIVADFGDALLSHLGKGEHTTAPAANPFQSISTQLSQVGDLTVAQATRPYAASAYGLGPILETLSAIENSLRPLVYVNKVSAELLLFFTTFNAFLSMARGIVTDNILENGFDSINDQELSAWLAKHGADPLTLDGALVAALYDQAFAFRNGVATPSNRDLAAGTVVSHALQMIFSYKGAFIYKMMAGMGDAIVAPFYELLKNRGVSFKFFTCVKQLHLSTTNAQEIAAIDVVAQVDLNKGVASYNPLITVNNLPCWPTEPDWTQLEPSAKGHNFEHRCNPLNKPVSTLVQGTDFDHVVLGISVAALPAICSELAKVSISFKEMLENAHTVRTQAFQVWVNRPLKSRFGQSGLGYGGEDETTLTGFVEPIDTYADMSHLISAESESPSLGVKSVAYFCGVIDDSRESYQHTLARVRTNAIYYFEHDALQLWPKAATNEGHFDWNVMVDDHNRIGPDRFDAQYWTANYFPTDRYVQTWSNSIQFRLAPHQSGFTNLTLAGDWTRTGIDLGCVEAAVISGNLAAEAIIGNASFLSLTQSINAYYHWLKPSNLPGAPPALWVRRQYVDYGGLSSSPQPDLCLGATLHGFIAKANMERLKRLCDQVFVEPSRGAVRCDPLSDLVIVSFGKIDKIRPQTAPFASMGYATEQNAAIWVPVAVFSREDGRTKSVHLAWFLPYMWVDNPLSLVDGREIYGYAKQWGWINLPSPDSASFALDAFGNNFGSENQLIQKPLLRVYCHDEKTKQAPVARSVENLRSALDRMSENTAPEFGQFLLDSLHLNIPQIFLKEIRSVSNGSEAELMQITMASATLKQVRKLEFLGTHSLVVYPLDSHPLAAQIGLADQRLNVGYKIDMDFELENGRVLWDSSDLAAERALMPRLWK
jgi:uncharacterized protein with NAD-binding domain and iron-sulfur cluster